MLNICVFSTYRIVAVIEINLEKHWEPREELTAGKPNAKNVP